MCSCLVFRGGRLCVGGGERSWRACPLVTNTVRKRAASLVKGECETEWTWNFLPCVSATDKLVFCLSPICAAFRLGLMSVSSKCLISSVKWKGQQILLLMPETQLHRMQIMSWGHWWTSWMESKRVFKYMLHVQFIGLEQEWGRGENSSLFLDCYWDFQSLNFQDELIAFLPISASHKPWIGSLAFVQCQSTLTSSFYLW